MPSFDYENKYYEQGFTLVAGVDEAGRGPLAGDVYAAAVILPKFSTIDGLNDSKKLSPAKRDSLLILIINKAVEIGIGTASVAEIDEINIENATRLAMKRAVSALKTPPEAVIIDGIRPPDFNIPQESIIKGDGLSYSIAAASIVAKVARDKAAAEYDKLYPGYGFAKHKGYGTAEHIAAIGKLGLCAIHRRTFCKESWLNK